MSSGDEGVLLTWAKSLARAKTVLKTPVTYNETPLRPVTVYDVGRTAHGCLAAIAMARNWKATEKQNEDSPWHPAEYWGRMEAKSLHELVVMRDAVFAQANGTSRREPASSEKPIAKQMELL